MTAPAIPAPAPKGRLGNGQLRRQVAEWLAARPGPHTVGEIAKDLGRSAGAVGNALTTLADRAEAARLAGKPVRYEANAATAAAAAAITPKAPAPPKAAPAAPKPAASPVPPAAPQPPARQPRQPRRPRRRLPPRRPSLARSPALAGRSTGPAYWRAWPTSRRCARCAPRESPPCCQARPAPARRAWSRRPSPT